ncbi:hypothetical protein GCM10023331_27170 [Algivirga pacifica]|uniref:Uncharacterized protein n=2 Tax=Algivirga pacifica TaxID=1162670 RepID=A0ABP9DHB1_9BACT
MEPEAELPTPIASNVTVTYDTVSIFSELTGVPERNMYMPQILRKTVTIKGEKKYNYQKQGDSRYQRILEFNPLNRQFLEYLKIDGAACDTINYRYGENRVYKVEGRLVEVIKFIQKRSWPSFCGVSSPNSTRELYFNEELGVIKDFRVQCFASETLVKSSTQNDTALTALLGQLEKDQPFCPDALAVHEHYYEQMMKSIEGIKEYRLQEDNEVIKEDLDIVFFEEVED